MSAKPVWSRVMSLASHGLKLTQIRYLIIGGSMAVLYVVLTSLAVDEFSTAAAFGSLISSAIVTPLTFVLQRKYTFKSTGWIPGEFAKFLVVLLVVTAQAAIIVWLMVDVSGLPTSVGAITATIAMPLVSYYLQKRMVFQGLGRA